MAEFFKPDVVAAADSFALPRNRPGFRGDALANEPSAPTVPSFGRTGESQIPPPVIPAKTGILSRHSGESRNPVPSFRRKPESCPAIPAKAEILSRHSGESRNPF
ncbi:hypothetical protein J5226_20900 [Lysobacter sp. K5869]|uniref:hypothetical protein n=1 Tax=Lysobacter sp. K5869 TaxID=2820808 RepID=UPI001C061D42|nr:hypothetical protein [Lysobacter sp. K5869]QWP76031.1 hypothetical protein J5226_20900 [Lysobacter sp. K5869]